MHESLSCISRSFTKRFNVRLVGGYAMVFVGSGPLRLRGHSHFADHAVSRILRERAVTILIRKALEFCLAKLNVSIETEPSKFGPPASRVNVSTKPLQITIRDRNFHFPVPYHEYYWVEVQRLE